jgi:hypothetical protein
MTIVGLLWSVDLCVSEMSSFFVSLCRPAQHTLIIICQAKFNLHVAMCDNDNVVIDEVKLINK